MSYNMARDELFFADYKNHVVRSMHLHCSVGKPRDVYRGKSNGISERVYGVCYMSDSDTLLVCSEDEKDIRWLVALVRTGSSGSSEWREAHRERIECVGWICHALTDSQVLVGQYHTKHMELLRVTNRPHIEHVKRIDAPKQYATFSATCGSETLVAMCFMPEFSKYVRLYRLHSDRPLEKLARVKLAHIWEVMWLNANLLLAAKMYKNNEADEGAHAVVELKWNGTQLEYSRELIANSDHNRVICMCAVNDGFALFDTNSNSILHYSFV